MKKKFETGSLVARPWEKVKKNVRLGRSAKIPPLEIKQLELITEFFSPRQDCDGSVKDKLF